MISTIISKTKLIAWDERPMMHKHYFEAVDHTFKNVLRKYNKRSRGIPFGGKVVVQVEIFARSF